MGRLTFTVLSDFASCVQRQPKGDKKVMLKEQYVVSGSRLAVLVTPVSCRFLGRSAVRISQHLLLEEGLLHFMSRIRTSGLGVV